MHGFCSNKTLFSASFSFTMFIGLAAVARRVLQNRVCPSFPLPGCFLGIGLLVFSEFWRGARKINDVVLDRIKFFRKTSFALNTEKMGQNWAKIGFFLNLLIYVW